MSMTYVRRDPLPVRPTFRTLLYTLKLYARPAWSMIIAEAEKVSHLLK